MATAIISSGNSFYHRTLALFYHRKLVGRSLQINDSVKNLTVMAIVTVLPAANPLLPADCH